MTAVELVTVELAFSLGAAGASALALLVRALAPRAVASADGVAATRSGVRRFLMGLFNGPALFLLSVLLMKSGPGKVPGLILFALLTGLLLFGLAAELPTLGERLLVDEGNPGGPVGPQRNPSGIPARLRASALAGALLAVALFVPFLGQAAALVVLLRGLGTAVFWLFTRRNPD
ncbi:MAG: hypothetical protein JNK60_02335 [Acidobacteria bacterium]|nr:hypothetical protein [Acidobacteriota bacterium]